MASINVRLHRYKKKDGTHNIVIVYKNDLQMRRNIGIAVRPEQFNKQLGLVCNHPNEDQFNRIILKKKEFIRNIEIDLRAKGITPFRDRVAAKYDVEETAGEPAHKVFAWWHDKTPGRKSIKRTRKAVLSSLKKYQRHIHALTLQGMTISFLDKYVTGMTSGKISYSKDGVSNVTLRAYIVVLKMFMEEMHLKYRAHDNLDYMSYNSYFNKHYKIKSKERAIVRDDELEKLKTRIDDPTIVRFLFCYYMGCRISDTYHITENDFQEDEDGDVFLVFNSKKTGEKSVFLLDSEALEFYNSIKPQRSNQRLFKDSYGYKVHNRRLKRICKELGLTRKIRQTYTKNKDVIESEVEFHEALSTHCGRHSFGYRYLKKMNGDVISLRDIYGHSSVQTTERNYAKRYKSLAVQRQKQLKRDRQQHDS